MHDDPLNLNEINEQFQEKLLSCVNSALRKKDRPVLNKVEIIGVNRTLFSEDYFVQLPEVENSSSIYYSDHGTYRQHKNESVARFSLACLPGCCGVCVSYYSYVYFGYRGTGLGKLLNEIRIEMARQMKFGLLICTDVTTNVAQTKILDSVGWTKALDFQNPKTGHTVNLHYIKL